MKKIISLLMVMVTFISGCATTANETSPCEGNEAKIGMVTDTGGIDDKSFNQGTWEGIEKYCEEFGVGAKFQQTLQDSEIESNLNAMAAEESIKVVVAAGYKFSESMTKIATAYPDKDFVLIDATPVDAEGNEAKLDNVQSFLYKEEEGGYLAGYIAAKISESGKIGYIGGEPVPAVLKFGTGYIAGAYAANPEVEIEYAYANTFNDAAASQGIAEAQVNKGVDIIFVAAGGANAGAVEVTKAINEDGKFAYTIGVDRDMYEDGKYGSEDKSTILTSIIKSVDDAAYNGVTASLNDEFKGGTFILGSKEEGISIPDTNPNLSDDQAIIDEAKKSLSEATAIATTEEEAAKIGAKVNGLK